MKQRVFTEDFKREAVRNFEASGRSIPVVAAELGIGKSTLDRWCRTFRERDLLSGPHEEASRELARLRKENALLRHERDLEEGRRPSSPRKQVDAVCVHRCEQGHHARVMLVRLRRCQLQRLSSWKQRGPSRLQLDDVIILAHVRNRFALSRQTYGSPRMHVELREEGLSVGRHRVARLMRDNGLKARQRTRFKRTTDSHHGEPIAPNLLDQDFICDGPDQKWGAHISNIWTAEGWLYLAIVVDLYSRRIIGWEARDRMKKDLAISAMNKAIAIRQPGVGLIAHSDRGSQYTSGDYCTLLKAHCIHPSVSTKRNCHDNAMVETVFKTIKSELVWRTVFQTRKQAINALGDYIDGFYNPIRRHSALGYKSPIQFEAITSKTAEEPLH